MLVRLTLSALAMAAATSMALAETGGATKGPQGGAMRGGAMMMKRNPPSKVKAPTDATSGRASPEGGKGKPTPPNAPNDGGK